MREGFDFYLKLVHMDDNSAYFYSLLRTLFMLTS